VITFVRGEFLKELTAFDSKEEIAEISTMKKILEVRILCLIYQRQPILNTIA